MVPGVLWAACVFFLLSDGVDVFEAKFVCWGFYQDCRWLSALDTERVEWWMVLFRYIDIVRMYRYGQNTSCEIFHLLNRVNHCYLRARWNRVVWIRSIVTLLCGFS